MALIDLKLVPRMIRALHSYHNSHPHPHPRPHLHLHLQPHLLSTFTFFLPSLASSRSSSPPSSLPPSLTLSLAPSH